MTVKRLEEVKIVKLCGPRDCLGVGVYLKGTGRTTEAGSSIWNEATAVIVNPNELECCYFKKKKPLPALHTSTPHLQIH